MQSHVPCPEFESVEYDMRPWLLIVISGFTLAFSAPSGAADNISAGPFKPDEHTVALYHFDEGTGNEARDACGDPEITLRAHKQALWGERHGFGATAKFVRTSDDANILIGPINNDKLELRTCLGSFTVEAWVRYTGVFRQDWGNTYGNICGTDEEGFSLPHGKRSGWNFSLHNWQKKDRLVPSGRLLASGSAFPYFGKGTTIQKLAISDRNWHHVAWQFRDADQTHFLFLDGKLFWKWAVPRARRMERCDIPFQVGGFLHSQDPPFQISKGNFEGEIDELRISKIMRYPVADRLSIIESKLPVAGLQVPYSAELAVDAAVGVITWQVVGGRLPAGLMLDRATGVLHGTTTGPTGSRDFRIAATDSAGNKDEQTFTIQVRGGRILSASLPSAFVGLMYRQTLQTEHMGAAVRWQILSGALPAGITLDAATGKLQGIPRAISTTPLRIQARDARGQTDHVDLALKVVPGTLRRISPDKHTVALWDWQGPSGKLIPDLMGDETLTLTWVNMTGDQRQPRTGWGLYPNLIGGGENGFVGPQHSNKIDLRTCTDAWTVEAWVKRGGRFSHYSKNMGGRHFDFGHICGTYDNSKRGVWELYLSDHDSPDGSMAPGVHFLGTDPDQALMDLHPWKRRQGIVGAAADAGIRDTEWHHVAWQFSYQNDQHQLFLDGKLIWQMKTPDGRKLVNNRKHDAQFSIGSRLTGYARYGGGFNWLGRGNFFGQIGEIRISNVRRY